MQLEYSLALSKELNHLDLTFETDGVTLKNYWFRIVINEKKTYNDKMHAHSFYEIHLCVKGWARFFVDGKESFLRAGEMAFVPKRKMHQISDISDDFEKIVWGYDLLPGTQSKGRGELVYYQAHTLWPFVIFSHIFCDFSLDIINILHLQCVTVSGSRYMNAGEF